MRAAHALLFAAAALAACTPSFQSPADVVDLRILAVRAEPPEAFVDLQEPSVQPVRVTALVADPNTARTMIADASLCFPTDNRLCQTPRLDLPQQTGLRVGEVSFDVRASTALAQLIVGALQDDKLKGLGGIRVQFDTTVADGDANGPVTAEKVLLYSTQPPAQANHNPLIGSLEVTRGDGTRQTLPPGEALQLTRFEQVGIRPILGDGAQGAEIYTATDLSGRSVCLREQLNYSFFSLLGAEWDSERADEPLPASITTGDDGCPVITPRDPPPFGIVRFSAYASGTGTFWIVVRDGRGGLSWFTGEWNASG